MESSRLFVKNLPPTLTEADFRKHFTTGGREVTDVKLISKRRIGYVGYKTPQEAAKAVKYFHRSYIRMSKISVEIARPISDPALPTAKKTRHDANRLPTPEPEHKGTGDKERETVNDKKRKRDAVVDESDPKLKEYLDVMRPGQTTASRLEGIYGQSAESQPEADVPMVPVEAESDDEYEEIPAHKAKRQKEDIPTVVSAPLGTEASLVDVPAAPATDDAPPVPTPVADATDDDWLRSRTNRLLDLVDPDDPAAFASVTARREPQPAAAAAVPRPDVEMADASPESEQQPNEQADEEMDDDSATGQIRRTSRLFVRNLPFKATEAELRTHFERYGEVEEVSKLFFRPPV